MMDNITERVMRLKMSNVPEDIQQNDYHHLCMYIFFFPCSVSEIFSVCITLKSPRTVHQGLLSEDETC